MKLSGPDAARFVAKPDLRLSGALIYGRDQAEVAARRGKLVQAIQESDGATDDLRVTRLSGGEVRRDGALVVDAMRAQGFFSGRPVVLLEDATDGVAQACLDALDDAAPEDGFLVATAGALAAKSKLRAVFEKAKNAVAGPVFDDPPDAHDVAQWLADEGAVEIADDVIRDLVAIGGRVDRSALRDLCAKLALYSITGGEIDGAVLTALAPLDEDTDVDEAVAAIFDGRPEEIGPLISRLVSQGRTPISIVLAAARHGRRVHNVLSMGGGDAAIGALRPPAFGPQRRVLTRHCQRWTIERIEGALQVLLETDSALRGASSATDAALLERSALRISMSAQRR